MAIKAALLRENDYVERSFAGNYNSVLAIGQKAQATLPFWSAIAECTSLSPTYSCNGVATAGVLSKKTCKSKASSLCRFIGVGGGQSPAQAIKHTERTMRRSQVSASKSPCGSGHLRDCPDSLHKISICAHDPHNRPPCCGRFVALLFQDRIRGRVARILVPLREAVTDRLRRRQRACRLLTAL